MVVESLHRPSAPVAGSCVAGRRVATATREQVDRKLLVLGSPGCFLRNGPVAQTGDGAQQSA